MRTQDQTLNGRQRRTVRALTLIVVCLASAWAALTALVMSAAALPAGGFGTFLAVDPFFGFVANMLGLFLLFAIIALVVTLAAWKGLKQSHRIVALVVTAALWGSVFVAAAGLSPAGPPTPPTTAFVAQWEIILQGTRSTSRDIMAEIFDSQGGTGGGGETPTATLCAYATNANLDLSNKKLVVQITVDDDVTTGTAAFSAPDSCSVDFSFRLLNPVDANGDGVQDSISIFARVRSMGVTTSQDGNQTVERSIFMRDNTFGWYIGFSRDVDAINTDGQWISIAPAGTDDSGLKSSYDWQNLGTNAGADEDYATFAYIMRNYGPWGYTLPTAGYTYSMQIDVGGPSGYTTITVDTILAARA